jgi:hypothetical protein
MATQPAASRLIKYAGSATFAAVPVVPFPAVRPQTASRSWSPITETSYPPLYEESSSLVRSICEGAARQTNGETSADQRRNTGVTK